MTGIARRSGQVLTVMAAGVAALAPLAIGGVLPWMQVALSALCLGLLVATALRHGEGTRGLRLGPLSGALLLGAGITAVQLVPLPRALVSLVSPGTVEAREDALGAAPGWLPLTLDVPATALELVKALAVAGLFVSVAALAHRQRRARVVLGALAVVGAAIAIAGGLQRALGAESILGVYRPDWSKTFVGTFVNPNHAAELFGLSLCLGIGLGAEGGAWRTLGVLTSIASIGGLVLCNSRGGLVVFGLLGAVLLALILARHMGRGGAALLAALVLGAAGALALLANEEVSRRFAQLRGEYLWTNEKVHAWRDALPMVRDFFWTGVGRGAFMAPFQRYRTVEDGASVTHPENVLLQLGSEWGVPLTLAVLGLGAAALWRLRHRLKELGPAEWGAGCGAIGVVGQNLVDFGLEFPGIALPWAAVAGVVVGRACAKGGLAQGGFRRWRMRPGILWALAGVWVGALGLGLWAVPRTLRSDDRHLWERLQADAAPAEIDRVAQEAIARHPCDYHLELLAAFGHARAEGGADAKGGQGEVMRHLNRVLRLKPSDVEAHRLAGLTLGRMGRRRQAALEYRTAFQQGLPLSPSYLDEIAVLGGAALEAVPQTTDALLLLARHVARRSPALADAACARAAELAQGAGAEPGQGREPGMGDDRPARLAVQLALEAPGPGKTDGARLVRAAAGLEQAAASAEAVGLAAMAYGRAGRAQEEERVLVAGRGRFPTDASLAVALARLRRARGDLEGARAPLGDLIAHTTDLEARRQAEEERAAIEDQAGNAAAAVAARARAHLYQRALSGAGGVPPAAPARP
ncbi:MAG TPA: O-antigen ligase family protein [Polyangia bacterium]|nr:O-antigen ligase family protein [Polyangia bacterium]